MKKLTALTLLLAFAVLLSGCTAVALASENASPAVVAWNYTVYGLSIETLAPEAIDSEIGQVTLQIEGTPRNNGESNAAPAGAKLFKIKDASLLNTIAIGMDGKYYKAYKCYTLP